MHFIRLLLVSIFIISISCSSPTKEVKEELKVSNWRALIVNDHGKEVPFYLQVEGEGKDQVWTIINGDERMRLDDSYYENDSLHIPLLIYEAEIIVKESDTTLKGQFLRKGAYRLPFIAEKGKAPRFVDYEKATVNYTGTYAVKLGETDAIGLFNQSGDYLTGTFLTATGDYRYLEGEVDGNKMFLSSFDGVHILRFEAELEGNRLLNGKMWSGQKSTKTWQGIKDNRAELPDPKTLTHLKEGYDKVSFTFQNEKGDTISLDDPKYQNKVVVIQIMGSWCPNCLDESKFMAPFYEKMKDKDFEVIGLSYERSEDPEVAYKRINRMKRKLNIGYDILYAGTPSKASESLPMLNKIMSFPTSIILDKKGEVREIHTGFSGPSTGHYYEEHISEFTSLVNNLLMEHETSK
ncbi:peroxiredoxin family protein [Flammeovirga agarivorans]|uniref:TlpA family protein disulfide reductase n=1 Tax=Flammeovirga agarivorans TaxID=2726742 RepID=A0A7X8SHY8_9BACT|nr:TlpA disulfide reductase family protein [Flammeovirga agarivorans]NLR90428.1 TlpA family protein disulfide reductase [Flammeovirga agarivorans]